MNFTLKQIQHFVTTAETLSVSKASRNLNRSQSAITNSLAELENALDVRLFNRSPKGMALTHEGHKFLISSRRIMAAVADAIEDLADIEDENSGKLVIGITSLLAGYYLSEPLRQFSQRYPNVSITLQEDEHQFIEHQLLNGEIDVGILMLNQLVESDSFETQQLISSELKLWLPVNHALSGQSSLSLTALMDEPVISLSANHLDQVIHQVWGRYNKRFRPSVRTESVEAVRNLVGAGQGIAIMPDFAYRSWTLDMQRVESIPIRETLPAIDIGLVWRRGSPPLWTALEFIDVIRDHAIKTNR